MIPECETCGCRHGQPYIHKGEFQCQRCLAILPYTMESRRLIEEAWLGSRRRAYKGLGICLYCLPLWKIEQAARVREIVDSMSDDEIFASFPPHRGLRPHR